MFIRYRFFVLFISIVFFVDCVSRGGANVFPAQTTMAKILKSKAAVDRMFDNSGSTGYGVNHDNKSGLRCIDCYGTGKCPMCDGRGTR